MRVLVRRMAGSFVVEVEEAFEQEPGEYVGDGPEHEVGCRVAVGLNGPHGVWEHVQPRDAEHGPPMG